jgi:hypothetical protein
MFSRSIAFWRWFSMRTRWLEAQGAARFHGLLGEAVLAVWCDIDPEHDAEFNDWYTHQHLPERVGIPGFLRGRRWSVPKGAAYQKGGQYFTLYEIETLQTLVSAPYMERLNAPTDWTKRTVPWFRNSNRTACKITATQGQGIGGYAATVEFGPSGHAAEALRSWITLSAMPKVLEHHEVVGIHLCEADESVTRAKDQTAEGAVAGSRGARAPLARSFLLVESIDGQGLVAACNELCSASGLTAHGAAKDVSVNRYRLLVSLSE